MHRTEQGQALSHPAPQRKRVVWGGIHSSHMTSIGVAQPASSKHRCVWNSCLLGFILLINGLSLKLELTDARLFWRHLCGSLKFSWRWQLHHYLAEKPNKQNTLLWKKAPERLPVILKSRAPLSQDGAPATRGWSHGWGGCSQLLCCEGGHSIARNVNDKTTEGEEASCGHTVWPWLLGFQLGTGGDWGFFADHSLSGVQWILSRVRDTGTRSQNSSWVWPAELPCGCFSGRLGNLQSHYAGAAISNTGTRSWDGWNIGRSQPGLKPFRSRKKGK